MVHFKELVCGDGGNSIDGVQLSADRGISNVYVPLWE